MLMHLAPESGSLIIFPLCIWYLLFTFCCHARNTGAKNGTLLLWIYMSILYSVHNVLNLSFTCDSATKQDYYFLRLCFFPITPQNEWSLPNISMHKRKDETENLIIMLVHRFQTDICTLRICKSTNFMLWQLISHWWGIMGKMPWECQMSKHYIMQSIHTLSLGPSPVAP